MRSTPGDMADKVWTAAELEAMSPAEQDDLFNSSIVTNLDDVPDEWTGSDASDATSEIARPSRPLPPRVDDASEPSPLLSDRS